MTTAVGPLRARLAEIGPYAADLTFTEPLAPGEVLAGVEFEGCTFRGFVWERAVLKGCTFLECAFVGGSLSMIDPVDSRFVDCTLRDCKALAVSWTRAATSSVSSRPWDFERCRLDLGGFQGMDLRGSRFVDCSLAEVDFAASDARRVEFSGSELTGATFVDTDLREADLIGVRGLALDLRSTRVAGARIDSGAALRLLDLLGLIVE